MSANDLEEFNKVINNIEDLEELAPGVELIASMARIISLREEAAKLEEDLYKDERRLKFAFYADILDDEEVIAAAATAKGRFKFLSNLAKKKIILDMIEQEEGSRTI